MHEFNNRIAVQRRVLALVNDRRTAEEELFSLSNQAIERWVYVNRVPSDSEVVHLLRLVSAKLFFLANKSQEQVTADYRAVATEVADIIERVDEALNNEKW